MTQSHNKDPLHGVTLSAILEHLVKHYGWDEMSFRIPVRCFMFEPTIKSSLQFLRRTPWARTKVEALYLHSLSEQESEGDPPSTS